MRLVAMRVNMSTPNVTMTATTMELLIQPNAGIAGALMPPAASKGLNVAIETIGWIDSFVLVNERKSGLRRVAETLCRDAP
jgi:uncharacterized membrane protein